RKRPVFVRANAGAQTGRWRRGPARRDREACRAVPTAIRRSPPQGRTESRRPSSAAARKVPGASEPHGPREQPARTARRRPAGKRPPSPRGPLLLSGRSRTVRPTRTKDPSPPGGSRPPSKAARRTPTRTPAETALAAASALQEPLPDRAAGGRVPDGGRPQEA